MPEALADSSIVGREIERAQIELLLKAAEAGAGGALVLRGGAGAGKTVLLEDAARRWSGARILRVTGESSGSAGAANAGLTELFSRLDRLVGAPPPLDRPLLATAAASGTATLRGPEPTDVAALGTALVRAFHRASTPEALLVLIDDIDLWDVEATAVLSFAARRLVRQRLALLITAATGTETGSLAGVPDLALAGLEPEAAAKLLRDLVGEPLDGPTVRRIVADTEGNPRVLLDLAARGAGTLHRLAGSPAPLPIGKDSAARLRSPLLTLAAGAQRLLLAAAAEPSGDTALVWGAGKRLGFGPFDAAAAEQSGLARLIPRISFTSPLIRAAVYWGAEPMERRGVHAALATTAHEATRTDLFAWHAALSATGARETAAALLASAARTVRGREGRFGESGRLLVSAGITRDPELAAARAVAAAEAALAAGAVAAAADSAALSIRAQDPAVRARAAAVRAAALERAGLPGPDVCTAYAAYADAIRPTDPTRAEQALATALARAGDGPHGRAVATALLLPPRQGAITASSARRAGRSGVPRLLAEGFALLHRAPDEALFPLRGAVCGLADWNLHTDGLPDWFAGAAMACRAVGETAAEIAWLERVARSARAEGALLHLRDAMMLLQSASARTGRIAAAAAYAERVREQCGALDAQHEPSDETAWHPLTTAWIGRDDAAGNLLSDQPGALHPAETAVAALEARSLAAAGELDYETVLTASTAPGAASLFMFCDAVPVALAEAGAMRGDPTAVRTAVAFARRRAALVPGPRTAGLAALCSALGAPHDEAEAHWSEACSQLSLAHLPADTARAKLLYGRWLLRTRRRAEARRALHAARGAFESLGADRFVRRAEVELAALGDEPAQGVSAGPAPALTDREREVARLAATGATNREIAAALFVSASTVDYHLRKVFKTLGIAARGQLTELLGESTA